MVIKKNYLKFEYINIKIINIHKCYNSDNFINKCLIYSHIIINFSLIVSVVEHI